MKQRFTNTTRKGGAQPLYLKTKKNVNMPLCRYGHACLYKKDCIYRHPKTTTSVEKSKRVCMPFVAGACEFGNKCNDSHPSKEECIKLKQTLAEKLCKFGEQCNSQSCLYKHPQSLPPSDLNVDAQAFVPERIMNLVNPANTPTFSMVSQDEKYMSNVNRRTQKRQIPIELWVTEAEKPENVYHIKDPFERFTIVNKVYTLPRFETALGNLAVRVIDLHFQTSSSFSQILDRILPRFYAAISQRQINGVWLITGTGHHVQENSHQR